MIRYDPRPDHLHDLQRVGRPCGVLTANRSRLRDGDRFWYERDLSPGELAAVRRNTTIGNIQANAFFSEVTVRGRVFFDLDRDGRRDDSEPGRPGYTVQLLDEGGGVVATTRTRPDGNYSFVGLIDGPGWYRVRVVPPAGWRLTSPSILEMDVTRGEHFDGIDFGVIPVLG